MDIFGSIFSGIAAIGSTVLDFFGPSIVGAVSGALLDVPGSGGAASSSQVNLSELIRKAQGTASGSVERLKSPGETSPAAFARGDISVPFAQLAGSIARGTSAVEQRARTIRGKVK